MTIKNQSKPDLKISSGEINPISELLKETQKINKAALNVAIFDLIPVYIVILNIHRQVIYANKLFSDTFGNGDSNKFEGKKIGEAINCIHSENGTCHKSKYCKMCGLVNTILKSQTSGMGIGEDILSLKDNHAMNIRIWSHQKKILHENFTFVVLSDISLEVKRINLEKIFFHDLLNVAGGLQGILHLMNESDEKECKEYYHYITSLTNKLIEEIKSHRTQYSAEEGNLTIKTTEFLTTEILNEVKQLFINHEISQEKKIIISGKTVETFINTDRVLLKRVLSNLLKNALEASKKGDSIIIGCYVNFDHFEFVVQNNSVISENDQLRLFQRAFSTKEEGRGYGIYTAKLLIENYLKGSVSFISGPDTGTKFFVRLPFVLEI